MEFSTNDALGKTWRQFNYMNYAWRSGYKEDVIVYCTHMDQIKIMWEAYKHFFDVDGEPIFYKEEGDHVVGVQDYYRNRTRDSLFDLFKTINKLS